MITFFISSYFYCNFNRQRESQRNLTKSHRWVGVFYLSSIFIILRFSNYLSAVAYLLISVVTSHMMCRSYAFIHHTLCVLSLSCSAIFVQVICIVRALHSQSPYTRKGAFLTAFYSCKSFRSRLIFSASSWA